MERSACLDGSDAHDPTASSYSERYSALKVHLTNAALILESFDQIGRGNLKQDDEYKELIKRVLVESEKVFSKAEEAPYNWEKLFTPVSSSPPLQPIGTVQQATRNPGLVSFPHPANHDAERNRSRKYPTRMLTIHFLSGGPNCSLDQIVYIINKGLDGKGLGRVDGAWQPDPESLEDLVPYAQKRIVLNCSNHSDTLLSEIMTLDLSSLWMEGTVAHLRKCGRADYFMTLATHDIPADTLRRNTQNIVTQINSYLRQTSERIVVTKVLSPDIFRFMGPSAEHLKMVRATGLLLTIDEGRPGQLLCHRSVVLQPFFLRDFKIV